MGPLASKPSHWKMTVAAAGVVAALGLVAWPWIPVHNSLSILQVGFEQSIPREEAQRLVSKLLRSGDQQVVLGAEFSADSGQANEANGGEPGRLRLSLLGSGIPAQKIQDQYTQKIREASERQLDPLFQVSSRLKSTDWQSPLQLAAYKLRSRNAQRAGNTGQSAALEDGLAAKVLSSAPLLKEALGQEIEALNRGFELQEFRFLAQNQSAEESGLNFSLPAWPRAVGVSISLYETLTVGEQSQLRALVDNFLSRAGLGPQQASLASTPQDWLPIMVRVYSPGGRYDRRLSEQLQAWIVQPSQQDMLDLRYEPTDFVDEAMQRFLPDQSYTIESEGPVGRSSGGRRFCFEFNVHLTGDRSEPSVLDNPTAQIDQVEEDAGPAEDW